MLASSSPRFLSGRPLWTRRTPQRKTQRSIVVESNDHSHHLSKKDKTSFDVYAISDLHTDHKENMDWVRCLSTEQYRNDVLVVAGDISDCLHRLRTTFELLLERFHKVAFVPGNHELWVFNHHFHPRGTDSAKKLDLVLDLCKDLGIIVEPTRIGNLWFVPLLSWHHQSFDVEPDPPNAKQDFQKSVSDYRYCKWFTLGKEERKLGSDALAWYFDQLNASMDDIDSEMCDVISFSHFAPTHELIPEKQYLKVPFLAKISGSIFLRERLKTLQPQIHIFGHTHIAWDVTLDDVRYVQCPLANPRERRSRPSSLAVATSASDPRIHTPTWPAAWNREQADWLPAKIYTYCSDPSTLMEDRHEKRTPMLNKPKSDAYPVIQNVLNSAEARRGMEPRKEKRSRLLHSGVMHSCYTKWGEYYKKAKRRM